MPVSTNPLPNGTTSGGNTSKSPKPLPEWERVLFAAAYLQQVLPDAVLAQLESISGWAGFAAWRHVFTDRFRTNLAISSSEYDNDITLTGGAASKSTFTWSLNALYSPVPKLDLGVEYRQATREVESGAEGDLRRLQATAKYSF